MRRRDVMIVSLTLVCLPCSAAAESITVNYQATAATVVNLPFGVSVPRETPITGYFRFDTSTPDANPDDMTEGEYRHQGDSAFLASFLGHEVTGSSTALYEIDSQTNYFTIRDGPGIFATYGGVMSFDGTQDENIELFFSASPGELADDTFINPFPLYDFESFLGTPHTFVIEDEQGRILMQIDSVQTVGSTTSTTSTTMPTSDCGDPTGGGLTASDALFVLRVGIGAATCAVCVCDADGSGTVTATDALLLLKRAIGQGPSLNCPPC